MQRADFEAFRKMMVLVAEQYGKPMSADLVRFYFDGLAHLPIESLREALSLHVRNPDIGQFMPKVADIIRAIEGTNADAALQAWAKVSEAVQRVGSYATVAFDDPVIHAVLADMGGWVRLCSGTMKEWDFKANEFVNRYRGYKQKTLPADYPKRLPGRHDTENVARGFPEQPPTLIGDAEKARAVIAGGTDEPRLEVGTIGAALKKIGRA